MNYKTSDYVISLILSKFEREIKQHLFSDKVYPESVTVETKYPGTKQSITIDFKEIKNDIRTS